VPSELRICVIVNPALPPGLLANTVAAIGIGLGAAAPQLAGTRLTDGAGRSIAVSSNRPVPILQADAATLGQLLQRALEGERDRVVVPFPAFARALHDFADYEAAFPWRDLSQEVIDGIGLGGPSKWVRSLTGALKLLR